MKLSLIAVVDGREIDRVEGFDDLGTILNKHGGAEDDIDSRLGKATPTFNKLVKMWRSGQLSKNTKINIFKSNVIAVLLYGCETWRMTKRDEVKHIPPQARTEGVKDILVDEVYLGLKFHF